MDSPVTRALLVYLHQRQTPAVLRLLQGHPVDPVMQGRAAESRDLELLLRSKIDSVREALEKAEKDFLNEQRRRT